jgi:hypothetical protein
MKFNVIKGLIGTSGPYNWSGSRWAFGWRCGTNNRKRPWMQA